MSEKLRNEGMTFALKVILPTVAAFALFVVSIFFIVLPFFEKNMLDRKREMIQELTISAISILEKYQQDEQKGILSREQAQETAIASIEFLRYGDENKDYFWITDMGPRMIMHPYRPELDQHDLSDYRDSKGNKMFIESVKVVKENGEGYINYFWQWKDDSSRIVPKLSYVKGFKPWGWIIGTGIYIEDVKSEIKRLESRLVLFSSIISIILAAILFYLSHHSLKVERKKRKAESELIISRERYKALVEASTEGTIILFENGNLYGNRHIIALCGYSENEFQLQSIDSLISMPHTNPEFGMEYLENLRNGQAEPSQFESKIINQNKSFVDVLLSTSRITVDEKNAVVINVSEIKTASIGKPSMGSLNFSALGDALCLGFFRILYRGETRFTEANNTTLSIFGFSERNQLFDARLEDIFIDREERKAFLADIRKNGQVLNKHLHIRNAAGQLRHAEVSAILLSGEKSAGTYIDGTIQDISEKKKSDAERENLIAELQTSMLFMNQPLKNFAKKVPFVKMNASIEKASIQMSESRSSAAIITSEDGDPIGIITDNDFKNRVLAVKRTSDMPVFEIMSAPIVSSPELSTVSEAIRTLLNRNITHIAVKNSRGQISGLAGSADLLQLLSYSSVYLAERIKYASTIDELKSLHEKMPSIIKSMVDSGARALGITSVITGFSDSITQKLIEMALEELGPSPVSFAFLHLGSEGRGEQTLATDQDNAIIYSDPESGKEEICSKYFNELGKMVCDWLNDIGYEYCIGNIMAMNTEWCQPMSVWIKYFTKWVTKLSPKDLLNVNIFFDFKNGFGDESLTKELRDHLNIIMAKSPSFLHHLAQNSIDIKPPINIFGNIVVESGGEHSDAFNVKNALMPITGFARVYALKHQIDASNTIARMQVLYQNGHINKSTLEDLLHAYNYLMMMRFKHQVMAIDQSEKPGNYINPKKLGELERSMLKNVFSQVSSFQAKLNFDFKLSV
jgi:PAS domain S-box-containing protein